MRLKKHFDRETLKDDRPLITHVSVIQAGHKWRPSTKIIERGQAEGWLARERDVLTLKTLPEDGPLQYRIVVPPGIYCCHCGEKCGDSLSAAGHVKLEHKGKESPSANNPAGYARHRFYMTERIEA